VRGLIAAYDDRWLTDRDVAQITLSWLGVDPAAAWKALSHLGAELSALIAYGLGRRGLVLAKDQSGVVILRESAARRFRESAAAQFREVVGSLPPEYHACWMARPDLEHLLTSASGR